MADVNWNDYTPVGSGSASAAEPVDWAQFEVVKPASTGRKLADIATAFAGGAVGATKAIADAGGAGNAVSQQLGSAQDTVQSWLSSQRQAEKAARAQTIREAEQSGSVLREVGAQLGGIAEAPVSTVAEAAGSVVPIVASMFTPVGRSAAARTALGAGLGAAQGAGSVKGSIHEAVEQQQREQGATPEAARQAADRAQAYTGPNADNVALGAGLGLVTGTTGVERLVSGALAGRATNQALLRRAATGAVTEGLPEAVQGGQERFASNVAQQREGGEVPTWQGVAGQAVAEGVAGGLLGAGTGAAVRGGHGVPGQTQGEPGQQPIAEPAPDAAPEPAAAPAIDPNAGPLSKAAFMAGDLGLAPTPVATAPVSAQQTMAEAMPRMTEEQQRAARIVEADLGRDIPAGVRAAREAEARDLAAAAPAAEVDLGPTDMDQGRVLRTFEPRGPLPDVAEYALLIEQVISPERQPQYRRLLADALDENLAPGARAAAAQALHATLSPDELMASRAARPDERLTLTPAERQAFGNEIDFEAAAAPAIADPAAEQINQLALAQQLQPGAPLRLDQAHGLRRQAAAAGIPVSVVPHPSGRGYDVQPTVRLPEEQRAAVPQTGPAVLGFEAGPSGRMVAGAEGVRPESRAEAVSLINQQRQQRQEVEAERARRADLGLSNLTRITPLDEQQDGAAPGTQPAPTTDPEVIDAPAREIGVDPASTITMPDGRPFATREQAQAELQRQGLTGTHEAAPAQGDPSLGFVGQQRSAARPANWRTNAMQAGRVARGLGLEPRGKRLAQIVADIDAADSARAARPAAETGGPAVSTQATPSVREPARQQETADVGATEAVAQARRGLMPENPASTSITGTARTAVAAGQGAPTQIRENPTFAPSRENPSSTAARAAQQQGRIEDFGETLIGARKMLYAEAYADGMAKAKALDVKAHPLSKTWPEPDYQKLLDGGTQPPTVALVRAMRDAVPTKPQSSWKLRGWSERVATLRDFADELLAGRLDPQAVRTQLNNTSLPTGIANQAALYEALGHERSLKGIELHAGSYSMYDGVRNDPPRSIWTVSRQAKASAFGTWPRELAKGDTREAAIEAFKRRAAQLAAEQDAPARGATFEIYAKRAGGARAFFIGKKIGRNVAELKTGFQDIKAARQYLADNQAELERLLTEYKAVPPVRSASNAPRIGEDYRKGADVSPQQFQDAFGFRGVQFGNYVEGPRRQQDLNQAYDALMDMAGVLNLPPRALSLGGRLGLAFGARGSGGVDAAAAHYEPGQVVINLTKRQAAGALGHEWWHALDNYFSRQRGDGAGFMTEGERGGDGVREEMRAAFRDLRNTINATGMQERSRKLDDRRSKDYWTTGREMSARAFESYLIGKLQDQSAGNDFLANVVPASAFALEGAYPYPTAGELPKVREAFDRFFQTVDTRRGEDGSVMLFSATSDVPPGSGLTLEQAQKAVDDALSGLRTPPPVRVVLRSDELGVDAPDGVMGAAIPGEGRIVIVASAHRSADAVVETLFHEMFHLGVRNVLPGSDYVQAMLDLAKRDARVRQYAIDWKEQAPDAPLQLQVLRDMGLHGSDLTARYEALAIEEGLAVAAQELRAQQQAGTRMGLRIRALANWLAGVAERMGMQRLAGRIRNMTYNEAERFVLRAIDSAGEGRTSAPAGGPAGLARYRTLGDNPASQRVGATLQAMTATNVKKLAGHKATDLRPLGLGFLGRRQLVDVYGDMLPELRTYSDLMARMDADKNEAGAGADQLAQNWAKLSDERALAELMHDSTLAQMDPAADYVADDNRVQYGALRRRFEALTPEAREVYTKARDTYRQHMRDVRSAIKERIERAGMSSDRKAAMLKRMDDEFFGHIKGVYFPLARFGQYVVVVKDAEGKTASVSRAETMAEADAMRGQMVAAFPKDKGFSVGKVLKAKDFVAERDIVGRGFMEQLYGVLDKQGMDAKQRAELEDALGQLYLSSLPDLSWAKHGIHRKGTAGFSQDARRAFAQNVFHGASYLAKLRYGDQLQDQLGEMQRRVDQGAGDAGFDSVKGQQVVDEMVKRHDAAMNPKTNALSTALTSVGFMFHLGLSPASAMVNLTQTALVAYPVMGARWGFRKSGAALLKASQEAVRGKNDITGSLSPDEKAAFDEAVRSGVIDVTMAHDLAGIAQGEDRNVSHKLRPVMNAASWMFHHAEKFNRQVTFMAAYRLARETGTSQQQAYQDAVQATYDGHFDYSANNRPRIMQGNVARVLLLFKQYGQNMVYTLVRNAQQALAAAKPEDRAAARKALAGLLTTHAMAAGVLGLPMVTTLLAAASMLGGDDDEPWDAQVAMQNMLADAFGQKPAEVLSHGLSRLTPWDISGRVGLDRLILPDVQEGLEGQRLGDAAMAAALGPVAAIVTNALKGVQEMSEGRYQRGLESMVPSVLRGPLKAWRYETEGVKDKTGIVVQDEVDAAALWGQAAGFSPSSVRNAYEGKSAIVGQDRALQARRSALVEQFAMAAMAKDEEGKSEAREAIQRFNEKNPGRRIQPMQLAQSVRMREKRIREAEDGVYLPKKRRDAMDAGRFAEDE
ncbi:PLxRFG domain-containing protein [Delftia sp. NA_296.1]|uniref:PLxRFG domain-containing protein n=1 Tax=Delftia sp. NA_296.1 TaxID=3415648 RepID=UPI0040464A55